MFDATTDGRTPDGRAPDTVEAEASPRVRTRRRTDEASRSQAGFSLVELLVVLAIIGMIATMVTPQVLGYLGRAKGETARIQVKNIAQAVELYYLDLGTYPTSQQGLQALVQPTGPAWRGPYVRDARGLNDPWGQAYLYRSPGTGGIPYEVYSLGSDGKVGGTGDGTDVASN